MEKINRSKLREVCMTILYQISVFEKIKIDYNLETLINDVIEIENDFVLSIINGVIDNKKAIDELANKCLNEWTISRLGITDQAILRMAIYELMYTETPSIVCINEAVELAGVYSDDAVKKMINGVLDKIYHEVKGE